MTEAAIKNFFFKDMLGFGEETKSGDVDTAEEKSENISAKPEGKKDVQCSVVARGTTFTGNIVSDGNVQVCGKVFGDITADNDVLVSGTIKGNVAGRHVDFKTGMITGDVSVSEDIVTDYGTELDGSVTAVDAVIDGRVNGNLTAKGDVVLKKNSYLEGNIEAATVTTEKGAIICGQIVINREGKQTKKQLEDAPTPTEEAPRFPEEGSLFAQK
ncbi:MAG: polymer-forming cytoskeletal protein [Synergistaceae bacterium]|nr:polymer-forming cytoskeletal protein [Synergistaceae bacterium]